MDILGTWKLESCVGRSQSGKTFHPYGTIPIGQLIYTSDKRMSVLLMNSDRKSFSSGDLSQAAPDEKAAAFDSFDSYAGSYRLDAAAHTIIHRIEMAKVPNWVGLDHVRSISVADQQLRLVTEPFEMAGEKWQVEVSWRRI